jgi:hypothetical protein
MKSKNILYSSRITIPNGEGLNALPISFVFKTLPALPFYLPTETCQFKR